MLQLITVFADDMVDRKRSGLHTKNVIHDPRTLMKQESDMVAERLVGQ